MKNILVTGASGFLGKKMIAAAAAGFGVVALSRKNPSVAADYQFVQGDFTSSDDLKRLDALPIDAVVHLAAETGGCSEESGLQTNVVGTRRLIRYLLDRRCNRFTLASSIAAVGSLHNDFVPLTLPMPDDHPCLAREMYGLSKALMEDVAAYFARLHPAATFFALRIGAVSSIGWSKSPRRAGSFTSCPYIDMGRVIDDDVIAAIIRTLMVESMAGLHIYNLVGPDNGADDPVADVIKSLPGKLGNVETDFYRQPGNEFAPLYDIRKIQRELGFVPQHSCRTPQEP